MPAIQERPGSAAGGLLASTTDENLTIDSRFGKITINRNKVITFPEGLLGMQENKLFCLANFPDPQYKEFKILQSIEDAALSFVVLPLERSDSNRTFHFIESKDVAISLSTLNIDFNDAAMLLVTSVHHVIGSDELKVSVNVRAPLVLDTKNNSGTQYVFQSNKYQIRQMLN